MTEQYQEAMAGIMVKLDKILATFTLGDQLTLSQRITKLEDELRSSRGK